MIAELVALNDLTFNQISESFLIKRAFKADGNDIPVSRDRTKVLFMKQFEEVKTKIKNKIFEMKVFEVRFSISLNESTSSLNRRYLNLNLHFKDGVQSLNMIKIKGSMATEKAIDLVRTRLAEYEVSLEEDAVATITDGASVTMKFGRKTEPLTGTHPT